LYICVRNAFTPINNYDGAVAVAISGFGLWHSLKTLSYLLGPNISPESGKPVKKTKAKRKWLLDVSSSVSGDAASAIERERLLEEEQDERERQFELEMAELDRLDHLIDSGQGGLKAVYDAYELRDSMEEKYGSWLDEQEHAEREWGQKGAESKAKKSNDATKVRVTTTETLTTGSVSSTSTGVVLRPLTVLDYFDRDESLKGSIQKGEVLQDSEVTTTQTSKGHEVGKVVTTTKSVAEAVKANIQFMVPDVQPIIDVSTSENAVVGSTLAIGSYAFACRHIDDHFVGNQFGHRMNKNLTSSPERLGVVGTGDIIKVRKPDGYKSFPVDKLRAPRDGETLVFCSIDPQNRSEIKLSFGFATKPKQITVEGVGEEILAFGFTGTTFNHQCGGVYLSTTDGCLVGFHGSGTSGQSQPNYFYPVTADVISSFKLAVPPKPKAPSADTKKESASGKGKDNSKDKKKYVLVRRNKGESDEEAIARLKKKFGNGHDYRIDARWNPDANNSTSSTTESFKFDKDGASLAFPTEGELEAFLLPATRQE